MIELKTEQETIKFARELSKRLKVGDVVQLIGPLGSGKSVIARTIIKSLGTAETHIPSPTYTLVQTYEDTNYPVAHMDLYRLERPEEIFDLDLEYYLQHGILLIEWPEIAQAYLPEDSIIIEFTPSEENSSLRQISVSGVDIVE
ncbi:MAG: tRNA (adenosine(37)-N6)-threonylcarbamoyltransferase complex ATPase subunit type 1 TsaE [Proteobacteria bacterium]|nr:tRNA (adenosine(37)-N6)-threonylcarbamoyltransferase complex ATPase subunit type 1 TsaE [Pseudomonadota bacterium]